MKTKRKKWQRLALAVALMLVMVSAANLQAQSRTREALSISDNDKAQIIQSVLMRELSLSDEDRTRIIKPVPRRIDPCKNSEGSKRTEYISSKNITASLLPKISCINFVLLGQEELESKSQEGIQYLVFDKFEIKGPKVEVSLATVYTKGKFFSTTGVAYEFRKVPGRWRVKEVGGYSGMT